MYTFDSRVRYSEADVTRRLSAEGIIDYFQDCSTFQSEDLGLGLSYLQEQHQAWFVVFWQIDIARRPETGERIRTGTSPYGFKGFMGYRNFWMETEAGEQLAVANSVWSLMNTQTMRPERIPQIMIDRYVQDEAREMEYLPRKIALSQEEESVPCEPIVIAPHHLDSNRHVNNSQYVRLALEAMEDMKASDREITRLLIEYKRQAHLGDALRPLCFGSENEKTVVLSDANDAAATPYAVCRVTFEDHNGGNA